MDETGQYGDPRGVGVGRGPVRVFVVSHVRVYREGLTQVLATYDGFAIVGCAETVEAVLPALRGRLVDVVLYDLRCPSGLVGLRRLGEGPAVSVVALGVEDTVEGVLACAEAGIAGYVTDSTALDELVARVVDAAQGRFHCPPDIAASLLHRLGAIGPRLGSPVAGPGLTSRELEVAALLQEGLSNKQIATRLTIQLATVKNHVHSILRKLQTPTRIDAVAVLRSSGVGPARPPLPRVRV